MEFVDVGCSDRHLRRGFGWAADLMIHVETPFNMQNLPLESEFLIY